MNQSGRNMMLAAGAGLLAFGAVVALKTLKKRYSPKGKVALVTGGSRGLGLLLARELAARGAKVAICARDEEELAWARDHLKKINENILAIPCDLTSPGEIINMVRIIKNTWGSVEILVNNAGVIQGGPAEVMEINDFELSMNMHFYAPLHCIYQVMPEMIQRQEGRIVNISSFGGKIPVPHLLPYTASKFALTGLSEGLHAELKKHSIVVTTVCPALIRTGSPGHAIEKGQVEKEFALFASLSVMPGLSMNAETAARKIIRSMVRGDAELLLGWPSKLGSIVNGISPRFVQSSMAFINKLLPASDGDSRHRVSGNEAFSDLIPGYFRRRLKKAADRYNEN